VLPSASELGAASAAAAAATWEGWIKLDKVWERHSATAHASWVRERRSATCHASDPDR
jgi:hypothetical protein